MREILFFLSVREFRENEENLRDSPLFYRGIEHPGKAKKGWDLNFAVG